MLRVEVDFRDVNKKLTKLIRYVESVQFVETEAIATQIADVTVEQMRDTISSSKKRNSFGSNLEDNIDWQELINDPGKELVIGIGNIAKLKSNAPYWEVLDQGGYIPYSTVKGAPLGSFEGFPPDQLGGNQNWERSGNKGFFIKPKKPIEPVGYIASALRNIDKLLKQVITAEGGKWIEGLAKSV